MLAKAGIVDHLKNHTSNSQYHPHICTKLTTAIQQQSVRIGVLLMTELNMKWEICQMWSGKHQNRAMHQRRSVSCCGINRTYCNVAIDVAGRLGVREGCHVSSGCCVLMRPSSPVFVEASEPQSCRF